MSIRYRNAFAGFAAALSLFLPMAAGSVAAQDDAEIAAGLQDAIVGAWVGTAAQPENDPFDVRLTFVSPKGGVSRYPTDPPCGGVLVGDRTPDGYQYQETITYGGTEEKSDGCLNGTITLTLEGDTLKYAWSGISDGQTYTSSGELKRKRKGR